MLPDPQNEGLAEHVAVVRVAGVAAGNTTAMVSLPPGIEYIEGSATLDGVAVADKADQVQGAGSVVIKVSDAILSAKLGELVAGTERTLRFRTRATAEAGGEMPMKAMLMFDSPAKSGLRTAPVEVTLSRGAAPLCALAVHVLAALRRDAHRSCPRATSTRCANSSIPGAVPARFPSGPSGMPMRSRFRAATARCSPTTTRCHKPARVVADYLAAALNVPQSRVTVVGRGSDEPLNNGKDAASLSANRRVEIVIEGQRFQANAPLEVVKAGGESAAIDTRGVVLRGLATSRTRVRKSVSAEDQQASFKTVDVDTLQPGLGWVMPESDAVASIASAKLAIKHGPQQTVELTLNGKAVDGLAFDGVAFNGDKTVALSRWRGVALTDGANKFAARILDADGKVVWQDTRTIHYGDGAVRAELDTAASKLIADGRTNPVIALRMYDQYGKFARPGTITAFTVDSPYRSMFEVDQLDDNQILSNGSRQPQVSVGENGLALIELEPTTVAGNALIHVRFNERQSDEYKVWLAPSARDWILVGVAEDTVAYNTISGNMETAAAANREEGLEQDGRVAFFAKGRIKGDFLLTLAYDSAARTRKPRASVSRT